MKFKLTFSDFKSFLNKLLDVLTPLIAVLLLLGILFGPDAAVVGDVYTNVIKIVDMLGTDGIIGLISIIIIFAYLKK
ncbi:MAG: hypothetical protein CBE38_04370 [Gammaproteobacteria bacterium TMED278]|jgi:phosphotransferase system  glucose/maltose/N-acetylglucosamine-specific IIC component|nr:hypothetical protein [Gammaproteobacteria bacterium]OUX41587.1 MAG: hypothetical protein CBE38_04370 [Gammaproteobacteria bacterium TMED278]RCL36661.1 MAG: hypothetical protein DBW99_00695 [SAR86 cluster bacterium]URQ69847.1 hypothetical protein M9C80_01455 [SAR86 cluster bacterium]|tara:strand:- start:54 stop:284 length:231 start_codon:yes stop_codon:yes gene_type:complete